MTLLHYCDPQSSIIILKKWCFSFFASSCHFPGSQQVALGPTGAMVNGTGISSLPTPATSIHKNCNCSHLASSSIPSSSLLQPDLLKVTWTSECKGYVEMSLYQHPSSSPVCHGSQKEFHSILKTVCRERRNCKGTPRWSVGTATEHGVNSTDNTIKKGPSCPIFIVQCTGRSTGINGMV